MRPIYPVKDFVSQTFYKQQNTPSPPKEYLYFEFLSVGMGVTSYLVCNWRLSPHDEGMDG